jgi:hypothetical protein
MSLLSDCTGRSLIEVSQISFLRRCPKSLLPILWCPAAIGINAMHRLGVAALAIIVMWWRWWLMMKDIVMWWRWWLMMRNVVVWWWRRLVGIESMLHLIKRSFLGLFLLAKDVYGVV